MYYTVEVHTFTLNTTYLLGHTKPVGDLMCRSQNPDLTTPGLTGGVVHEITRTVHFFTLNFRVHAIYIPTSLFLSLYTNRANTTCSVKVDDHVNAQNLEMWSDRGNQ